MRLPRFARTPILPLALALGLSACVQHSDEEDRATTKTSDSEAPDPDGKLSIKAEGFSLDIDIPDIEIDTDTASFNKAGLYPGSKVRDIEIRANSETAGGESGRVEILFDSPAKPGDVADWFVTRFTDDGGTVSRKGNRVSGTSEDGDRITLTLDAAGSDASTGRLVLLGS